MKKQSFFTFVKQFEFEPNQLGDFAQDTIRLARIKRKKTLSIADIKEQLLKVRNPDATAAFEELMLEWKASNNTNI